MGETDSHPLQSNFVTGNSIPGMMGESYTYRPFQMKTLQAKAHSDRTRHLSHKPGLYGYQELAYNAKQVNRPLHYKVADWEMGMMKGIVYPNLKAHEASLSKPAGKGSFQRKNEEFKDAGDIASSIANTKPIRKPATAKETEQGEYKDIDSSSFKT